jgi:alcohol dehydrogenase class IV/choline kinase
MKAIIFNSGIGKRMGDLTHNKSKCMVELLNGETIFERQIRILSECGIKEFVITTGPFEDQLINVTKKSCYSKLIFHFVHNPIFDKTNYIYSFYLARNFINDDFLSLHGDLVFDKQLIIDILKNPAPSICLINPEKVLPEKDFKGRIIDGKLREVSINIFDKDCFAFQPLYKLSEKDIIEWLNNVTDFIEKRKVDNVYAENALNEISSNLNIMPLSYENYYIDEIDNKDDYVRVANDIRFFDYREQQIFYNFNSIGPLLEENNITHPFVVVDSFLIVNKNKNVLSLNFITKPLFFSSFQSNPIYEDVVKARKLYIDDNCDGIISIGGGSAIDTAKALKLFLPLSEEKNFLDQKNVYMNIKHISIPTTAGTGSESTKHAVIYFNANKQSLSQDSIIPDIAILEAGFIKTLPLNQKKATVFDALCQAIESMWSINSCSQSQIYSENSISLILNNLDKYLNGELSVISSIQKAASLSGRAINLTATTAAHAMSYKLTSSYNIPHGQAVAICLPGVWKLLIKKMDSTNDVRGSDYLSNVLTKIDSLFGCSNHFQTIEKYESLLEKYKMYPILNFSDEQIHDLAISVNPIRLKNFPVTLSQTEIGTIYGRLSNHNK